IYIDPPYNTEAAKGDGNTVANDKENIANNKFIYRDKFSRNGWLNMMNERLVMAKKLLRKDGVIFVSIDDSEQAYLKVLMDEIFGEENFISSLPFISNLKGRQANTSFAKTHEYVIVYKNTDFDFIGLDDKWVTKTMPAVYKERTSKVYEDEKGKYVTQNDLSNSNSKFNVKTRPYLCYEIFLNKKNNDIYPTLEKTKYTFTSVWPRVVNGLQGVWRWSGNKVLKEWKNLVFEQNTKGNWTIKTKKRDLSWICKSLILGPSLNTKNGNDLLLKKLNINWTDVNKNPFNTCKPIDLIILILKLHKNKNARILDFFAGSGTTAQAVMELNREDGGNRTYTIVTNNENNIAYDVTYERLYRINKGIGTKGETFKWTEKNEPFKNNLNVYKTEYYDTEIDENSDSLINQKLKQNLKEEMNNFGINNFNNDSKEILTKLLSLKPQEKLN
ncbi:DNA methyltransferase, partial [Mycoplasmopsis lipofaciens]|uniref:DNA methyltransferase n=1 Tax=Mycoplasmopsis lipofaciens TaxID=114884 RepID=UPI0004871D83